MLRKIALALAAASLLAAAAIPTDALARVTRAMRGRRMATSGSAALTPTTDSVALAGVCVLRGRWPVSRGRMFSERQIASSPDRS